MPTKRSDGRYLVRKTLSDGRQKCFYGKTLKEARAKAESFSEEKVENIRLFNQVASEWWNEFEPTVSHKTISEYSPAFDRIVEEFGDYPLEDIEPADIQAFINKLKKKLKYSTNYIKAHKIVMSKVFEYEITRKGSTMRINPLESVKIPKGEKTKVHAATDKQELKIKQSVDRPFGLFAFLLIYTGCRSQEALALKWSDIDFEKNSISVNKALTFPHNQPVIKETKTENGNRIIPLLGPLKRELLKVKPENNSGEMFVFGGVKPLSQQEYKKRWRQYTLSTGFRKEYFVDESGNKLETLRELQTVEHERKTEILLTPHQLRHSFATMCLEAELAPEETQKLLGHADIKTTVNVYADIRAEKQKRAAEKLNAFVEKN